MIHLYAKTCKSGILMVKIGKTLQGHFQLYISFLLEGNFGPRKAKSENVGIAAG